MPTKGPARSLRVADQIQRELAEIIRTELKDPRVAMITLTGVEVTADYSHAKVFYTLMGSAEQRADTETGLKQAGGFLRSQIARRIKRPVSGVLMLDKARGASSNAALQQAKRLYQAAKAGHAGTLDPLATGLLPVLFGEATKFSSDLLDADKTYVAELRLGISTATADAEGEVIATRAVNVNADQLEAALANFRGDILQTPPLYSALKHAGKPMYAYARAGINIEQVPRPVRIHALELQWFEGERLALSVRCSKGTYIRSIAHDLGELLGCGAHLAALRRTAVGRFGLDCAHTLEQLEVLPESARDALLLPLDALLQNLPEVRLEAEQEARFLQGQAVAWNGPPEARVRVCAAGGGLLGVGELDSEGLIRPKRVIAGQHYPPAGKK